MKIEAEGISVVLPPGWSGTISDKDETGLSNQETALALHAANFDLPVGVPTFAGNLTRSMRVGDIFVALVEWADEQWAYKGLYEPPAIPRELQPDDFDSGAMPSAAPGLFGFQHFCTLSGRPFCLFVIASCSEAGGGLNLSILNRVLSSIVVAPRASV